jgi:uncharacterized coiled-coil protein SlyX
MDISMDEGTGGEQAARPLRTQQTRLATPEPQREDQDGRRDSRSRARTPERRGELRWEFEHLMGIIMHRGSCQACRAYHLHFSGATASGEGDLRDAVCDRQSFFGMLERARMPLDREVASLENKLERRDKTISHLKEEVSERDEVIGKLRAELARITSGRRETEAESEDEAYEGPRKRARLEKGKARAVGPLPMQMERLQVGAIEEPSTSAPSYADVLMREEPSTSAAGSSSQGFKPVNPDWTLKGREARRARENMELGLPIPLGKPSPVGRILPVEGDPQTVEAVNRLFEAAKREGDHKAYQRALGYVRRCQNVTVETRNDVVLHAIQTWRPPKWAAKLRPARAGQPAKGGVAMPTRDDNATTWRTWLEAHPTRAVRGVRRYPEGFADFELEAYIMMLRTRPVDRQATERSRSAWARCFVALCLQPAEYCRRIKVGAITVAPTVEYLKYAQLVDNLTVDDMARHLAACGLPDVNTYVSFAVNWVQEALAQGSINEDGSPLAEAIKATGVNVWPPIRSRLVAFKCLNGTWPPPPQPNRSGVGTGTTAQP